MALIKPFCGFLYNREKIDDLATVVAPPYDVITPSQQDGYYRRHPYNVIRLILGKEEPTDKDTSNKYTRAAAYFSTWKEKEVLTRSRRPSIYLYLQDYTIPDGRSLQRKGFICLVRLEEFGAGVIRPHERTLSKPKVDRLNLMRACSANFSSIFSIYADPDRTVEQVALTGRGSFPFDITDENGVRHRFWSVDDEETIETIQAVMMEKSLLIADGHHRYETALNYRDLMRSRFPGLSDEAPFNYTMMYCTNMHDAGLVILPTHRLVRHIAFDLDIFAAKAQQYFDMETFPTTPKEDLTLRKKIMATMENEGQDRYIFCMFCKKRNGYFLFRLKDYALLDGSMEAGMSTALRRLDTNILERLIFNQLMGISCNDPQYEECFKFVHSDEEAVQLVQEGDCEVAFLGNPTRIEQVNDIVAQGEKMPQKSTYFYPKLLSGLVINQINPEEKI
ncbi:MAG: DUF1015 domain-containing protein [Deltaproteobacteria bacterium]|nr:DUF1015 domain-containing protein [Deltaproteobacteria bacterium]